MLFPADGTEISEPPNEQFAVEVEVKSSYE